MKMNMKSIKEVNDNIVIEREDGATLIIDKSSGGVSISNDNDAPEWISWLSSFYYGAAKAAVDYGSITQNPALGVRALSLAVELTSIAVRAEREQEPREAVRILGGGIAQLFVGYAAGQAAGWLFTSMLLITTPTIPLVIVTAFIAAGLLEYFAGGFINNIIQSAGERYALGVFDLTTFVSSPLFALMKDPLILDLDGDGVELSQLNGVGAHFDFDGDGFSEATGWFAPDDGMLVRDTNKDNIVSNPSEIFGSTNQDGFAVLETLDSNGDGTIDRSDEAFNDLRVWRDIDQDGVSDEGELYTLASLGIESIRLSRENIGALNNGNYVGFSSSFVKSDGSVRAIQSVYFATDATRNALEEVELQNDGVVFLPYIGARGLLHSSHWKASHDGAFRQELVVLTEKYSEYSVDEFNQKFESLIFSWADLHSVDENSRGPYVNARHLSFVEKYFGGSYREVYADGIVYSSPSGSLLGARIEAAFRTVVKLLSVQFLIGAQYHSLLIGGNAELFTKGPYAAWRNVAFPSITDDISSADAQEMKRLIPFVQVLTTSSPDA